MLKYNGVIEKDLFVNLVWKKHGLVQIVQGYFIQAIIKDLSPDIMYLKKRTVKNVMDGNLKDEEIMKRNGVGYDGKSDLY